MESRAFALFMNSIKRDTTRSTYTYSLHEFMRYAKIQDYESLAKLTSDKAQLLLENWVMGLSKIGLKPSTIFTKLHAVELFFEMNKILINKRILHKLGPSYDYISGGGKSYTREEIQRMLSVTTKLRTKALILFLSSTGVRPGSLIDPVLRLKHIEKMPNGCKSVKIYDDSKEGYFAFLTPEASKALDNYLESRKLNGESLDLESPLFSNSSKNGVLRKRDYLSDKFLRQLITNVLNKAGIERTRVGNRFDKAPIYAFRKYFNTVLKINNDVNSNIAEKLMAHKRGLDGAYLTPSKAQCFAEFEKAIPELTISDEARDKAKITKLEIKRSEHDELKSQVTELVKIREIEDKVSADLVSFYETGDENYLKNFPPEYFEYWRMWKALRASGKKIKKFTWPEEKIPEDIKQLLEAN